MNFACLCLQSKNKFNNKTPFLSYKHWNYFVKERERERNSGSLVVSWCLPLYETLVVCSQNDSPCLLTNIPDPLLCDCLCTQLVVLWLFMRPKEVFHTTNITNLTVPLSTDSSNWFLTITWLQWCRLKKNTHHTHTLSNVLPTPPAPSLDSTKK